MGKADTLEVSAFLLHGMGQLWGCFGGGVKELMKK